ncbi:hypothetical protein E1B28_011427 [Marasmius oreades]|uniref:Survival protein SurE-like phosphatase/nucleotidase domain-containing protein n=1 Tax=Marasmius oreades TaxID=181124 RepID=A0A9P7RU34_9AGAR|nr:uncharacterized protein E1B28_011427 [Marasmius oreades]KAG7089774.1 hypothetical protein E1B28_011427 [Marasmius oreades]
MPSVMVRVMNSMIRWLCEPPRRCSEDSIHRTSFDLSGFYTRWTREQYIRSSVVSHRYPKPLNMKTAAILSFVALFALGQSQRIVLTNDDGWAVTMIRAQYDALKASGFSTVLSAPAENQSGKGSSSAPPTALEQPCQFDTCPVGSPPEGSEPDDPNINYVNSFPVDAARFGIQTLSSQLLGDAPDFVVSGPNIGNNLFSLGGSGTVGAASEAALEGIPSTAFSAGSSVQSVSYTTLTTDPDSDGSKAARVYAELTVKFTNALLAGPKPILPPNISVNVNYPPVTDSCATASDFKFVLTRVTPDFKGDDVKQCGVTLLPDETSVIVADTLLSYCFVTVSVIDARIKKDVDAATQQVVRDRLSSFLSCLIQI